MTKKDIETIFAKKIIANEIHLSDNATVDADVFLALFIDAEPNYLSMVACDGEKGYKLFFDKCKAEGIFI